MQKDTGGVIGPQVDKDKGKFNAYVLNFHLEKALHITLRRKMSYQSCVFDRGQNENDSDVFY